MKENNIEKFENESSFSTLSVNEEKNVEIDKGPEYDATELSNNFEKNWGEKLKSDLSDFAGSVKTKLSEKGQDLKDGLKNYMDSGKMYEHMMLISSSVVLGQGAIAVGELAMHDYKEAAQHAAVALMNIGAIAAIYKPAYDETQKK